MSCEIGRRRPASVVVRCVCYRSHAGMSKGNPELCRHRTPLATPASVLLVGPYDPHCGEYTFLAPPLGVWRLKGYLDSLGHSAHVFDPNCCAGPPEAALERLLEERHWDVVGISTTGMTLRYDLALAHLT